MKQIMSNLKFILVFSLSIYFGLISISISIDEIPKSITLSKCENGYSGNDCEIPTCIGYKLCAYESFCLIKNNIHLCVCRFFDNNGSYREIPNCIRKYYISNGVCFLLKTGEKICDCEKDWMGNNCDQKNNYISFEGAVENLYKQKLNAYKKLKYHCVFKDKNDTIVDTDCYNQYNIPHGICYIIRGNIHPVCSCDDGWWGLEFDCDGRKCDKYDGCKNGGRCCIKNNKNYCLCVNDYYGDNCEKRCNISCGYGKIVINKEKNICKCLCTSQYLLPDCKQSKKNFTKKITNENSHEKLDSKAQKRSVNAIQLIFETENNADKSKKTHKTKIKQIEKLETKRAAISEKKLKNIRISNRNFPLKDTVTILFNLKAIMNFTEEISFFETHAKAEFILITIALSFLLLVIGIIYLNKKFLNSIIRIKIKSFGDSNTK